MSPALRNDDVPAPEPIRAHFEQTKVWPYSMGGGAAPAIEVWLSFD